ncbi:MAG TPA: hypothetical protein VFW75_10755 [Acetobacteraceae bacterium]|nr:hypothetical protein [Acetobacteraceae bacterium]
MFAEDFDSVSNGHDQTPEVIAPVFTAAELAAARADAWAEGREAALAELNAEHDKAWSGMAQSITQQLVGVGKTMHRQAESHAETIARLLLDTLATLFPQLCARHGETEAQALAGAVLGGLTREPVITVRAGRVLARHLTDQLEELGSSHAMRVEVVSAETDMPGDFRITWHDGQASRDAAALWEQVAAVLAGAGLNCSGLVMEMQDAA